MSTLSDTLTSLLETARHEHVFSAYSVVAEGGGKMTSLAAGKTSYWQDATPVTQQSWFDIGSVTKAVCTTSLFAIAVDRNEIALTDVLSKWIPEFKATPLADLSIGSLLTHSAGVLWWHPLYEETDKANLRAWFKKNATTVCKTAPGTEAVYSDLGFLLLGLVAEIQWGALDDVFRDRVAKPLGLTEVAYRVPEGASVVSTEYCLRRKKLLTGEVFDENCAALGGVCSHAGLFATANGLAPWCREWLSALAGKSSWLGQETAKLFITATGKPTGTRALGWDTKSPSASSAGVLFSERSFGHLGYPGCSVWIDSDKQGYAIFLSNRVHPSRVDERIRRVRPLLHDAIAKSWG